MKNQKNTAIPCGPLGFKAPHPLKIISKPPQTNQLRLVAVWVRLGQGNLVLVSK